MATQSITFALDEALIQVARNADPDQAGRSDAEVIQRALARYLGIKALDAARARGTLDEDEADRVAVEELHAMRRERRDAA